jgi:putative acetyltransferase
MTIRKALPADLTGITRLFYVSINKVNSKDYTQEQVETWASAALDLEYWQQKLETLHFWVADEESELLGFVSMAEDGYLDHIFVHDQHQNEGIATDLLATLEQAAQELNISRVFADVSITAKPFFEKRDFALVRENRKEFNGVVFVNFRMEKFL